MDLCALEGFGFVVGVYEDFVRGPDMSSWRVCRLVACMVWH